MITDTEAIVLRQVKTLNGRRMLLLFSNKFGKISVGTNLSEGGKNKSALITRPFTYGRYELFKGRDSYNLNGGQVIKSFYSIGENLEKYMAASYVLELTEKMLVDELPQPKLFRLLRDFLEALEKRQKKCDTLVMAYMVKTLDVMGEKPQLKECACCGKKIPMHYFSIAEGGMICQECANNLKENPHNEALIYDTNFGIVEILEYYQNEPFVSFEKLALDEDIMIKLKAIIKRWYGYHFGVDKLKSEELFFNEL